MTTSQQPYCSGPTLRAFRFAKGWTLPQLADNAGLSVHRIKRMEYFGATKNEIDMISRGLKCSHSDIIKSKSENATKRGSGDRLKALRVAAGLSQGELARRAGYIDGMTVRYQELRGFGYRVAVRLAKALNVDVDQLFG